MYRNRAQGCANLNFDTILKANQFLLAGSLDYFLELGSSAMTVPVEVEFAANINLDLNVFNEFRVPQIRPMKVATSFEDVTIQEGND